MCFSIRAPEVIHKISGDGIQRYICICHDNEGSLNFVCTVKYGCFARHNAVNGNNIYAVIERTEGNVTDCILVGGDSRKNCARFRLLDGGVGRVIYLFAVSILFFKEMLAVGNNLIKGFPCSASLFPYNNRDVLLGAPASQEADNTGKCKYDCE